MEIWLTYLAVIAPCYSLHTPFLNNWNHFSMSVSLNNFSFLNISLANSIGATPFAVIIFWSVTANSWRMRRFWFFPDPF